MRDHITIAGRKVGKGCEPFIVAEAGINHNGDLDRALAMVTAAKEAGCDAVKFATLKASEFCNSQDLISYHFAGQLITEPEIEMFRRCELPDSAWRTIREECDRHGIIFFSTPQNESDLKHLLDVGVPCIKVGSDDFTNYALLRAYASYGLPMILSTGMTDRADLNNTYALMEKLEVPFMFLVCTSEYPCPPENANLNRIKIMRVLYEVPVGFSDHTVGTIAGTVARALGACYLEKHFTLDNQMRGPDHAFSANPMQLGYWVRSIRNVGTLLGSGNLEPSTQERVNREKWRRKSGQQLRGVYPEPLQSMVRGAA